VAQFTYVVEDIVQRKQRFFELHRPKGFPNVLGAVDGTHIDLISPKENEDIYVNRKFVHSINCQVVSDASHRFLDINSKYPGSSHDSFVWKQTSVRERLSTGQLGDCWFIGEVDL